MCHMTKYSTIRGVLQQPLPGVSPIRHFERGEGPGDEIAGSWGRGMIKVLILVNFS